MWSNDSWRVSFGSDVFVTFAKCFRRPESEIKSRHYLAIGIIKHAARVRKSQIANHFLQVQIIILSIF